jgi:uncharacterized protein (DUF885 family)
MRRHHPSFYTAALALAACARNPAPAPIAAPVAAAVVAADSLVFERFVADYAEGGRRGVGAQAAAAARDSLQWLHGYETSSEEEGAARATGQLAQLRAIDTTKLSVPQRIDWLLVESWLKRTVYDTILHTSRRVPGRYLTLGNLTWRVAGDRPPTPAEWLGLRTDLERAPRVMALGRQQLAAPPPLWVHLAVSTARSYSAFLADEYVRRVGATAPDSMKSSLLATGDSARRALDAWAAFLQDTLRAGADNSWMAGAPYYDWVLHDVNFLPFTAQTMIVEGRRIHAATKLALDSLAHRLHPGSGPSWHQLAEEMQERHPEPGHIIEAYRQASLRVQALLARDTLIAIPPNEQLIFVPTPPQLRETYAWGGYGGITLRDSVATGRFFVTDVVPSMSPEQVRQKLRTQSNGWISVIALHEGYPGHHLQAVYTRKNPSRLRRMGGNTYNGEGWALYSEHWMARAGLFADNPDGQLGQLQMRLWRTARVIIDPSLHTGAMSYEQAVQFFVDEVGLERTAAEAEVNRFTTWPTQAPSYIIGWLEIERLERDVRAGLGARFSEKEFVEKVLEAGPLPLALLRRSVLYAYGLGG